MIKIKNISINFGNGKVIENKDFNFERGKITVLVGKNGTGKTSLINSILKMNNKYEGKIFISNKDIENIKKEEFLVNISMCFQNTPIFVDTVKNNLKMDIEVPDNFLISYLEEFNTSSGNTKEFLERELVGEDELSAGQRQKVGIIRSLVQDKTILIFDEPTANLDKKSVEKFIEIIKLEKLKSGKVIIIATHDERIIEISDKKYVFGG